MPLHRVEDRGDSCACSSLGGSSLPSRGTRKEAGEGSLSSSVETSVASLSRPSSAALHVHERAEEAESLFSPAFSAAGSTLSVGEEERRTARFVAQNETVLNGEQQSDIPPPVPDEDDEEQVGWSYMFKQLLSLNHKDAGTVTYMEKLPSVPAKAGSAAAAAPARLASPSLSAPSPFSPAAAAVGYVRMVPSKDLAVASSVCDESVEAVRFLAHLLQLRQFWARAYEEPPSPGVRPLSEEEKNKFRTKEPMYDPFNIPLKPPCNAVYKMHHGVYQVFWDPANDVATKDAPLLWKANPLPDVHQFLRGLKDVMTAVQNPACKSFCYKRLKYLEEKFNLHLMFNSPAEVTETKCNFHRDFYNVRKVDTHIHHSACMQQKHLLRFIRKKYRTEPETVVAKTRDGNEQTLMELFHTEVGIGAHDASIDHLNVHALGSCFQRFDLFNQKYNPFGQKTLRDVFLKTDNYIEGRFLAEITREVISDLEERKYQHVEWRLSIYGRSRDEWTKLAKWVVKNKLSSKRVRWMVQVPRLYHVYRRLGMIRSFGELLENIFEPLYDAVRNPEEHPEVFTFLHMLVGWDSVDDESYASKYTMEGGELPKPAEWTGENNPPYSYWGYYMYANIRALNEFMVARGLRALAFRPHCGEAGSVSHLATMFLLADAINHGIMLKKCPVLQYLFYLAQIGLAVSPLSNNALFMDIAKNPLCSFFKIGLNVSISTDDPLMFHFTDEPLLEEYSVAAHTWKLSPVDLCELARNSVLQSGFEAEFKRHWLGPKYKLGGRRGNCMRQTNVSNIRLQYREDALREELSYMHDVLALRIALSRPFSPAVHPAICPPSVSPRSALLPEKSEPTFAAFEDAFEPGNEADEPAQVLRVAAPENFRAAERETKGETKGGKPTAKDGRHEREASTGRCGETGAGGGDNGATEKTTRASLVFDREQEELHASHSITVSPPDSAEGTEKDGEKKARLGLRSPKTGSDSESPGTQTSPRMRPLLLRDAAMKKLLEVAEESAVMDLGEIPGGVSSPMPRSESFEVLDGPSREALQTLDAYTHLEAREENVDMGVLKVALTSQRSPALLSGSGTGRTLRRASMDESDGRRRSGAGLLQLLTSPLLQQQLSHASSVIVGEYANSTAEGDEERRGDSEGDPDDAKRSENEKETEEAK
ncbi:AMP deaminase [Toxoplasma gondii VEG]|uniref:AMP deaminase n=1 Tax=Toxoplasma gondii (strain ATCC 50861 / VEG) TaxID=432359 RepID=V4ZET5_TOXGV|nr:AMP deaminase [Toxoplasma gondii VEG]CEL76800.1 TPA: adenosine monophosphate deaminase, putative [Toxoplasma gondii VEG]